ncbi:hypothetical protein JRO89_XSUnG0015600 [Xanthoceras sorbifolium]|uniref:Uncharacterized protein n=1 Tax=Xanthoceras sorbifolium TaxID=99658 RepID=A0ABQ8H0D4_9ROSI|nr:hypothetical protein JRO89_XSUnG0015600 [Xanthoceras sorbifolium]
MAVMGKGIIKLRVNGSSQVITKVFYYSKLQNNLLSIGQLQEHNLAILIQHGECKIYHHERGLIMQTQMSANRMFILLAEIETKVEQAQKSKAFRIYDPVLKKTIISKDVVFEEEKKWEWSKLTKEASCAGLEWGDDEEPQEHEAKNVHEEKEQVDNGVAGSGSSSSEEAENNPLSLVQERVRRAPTWMKDYISGQFKGGFVRILSE